MRIVCIGGGPAGLYFAMLMKRARPDADVTVIERNKPGDTFGWGVVFSDQTLGNLRQADAASHNAIVDDFVHWDDIDIHFRGRLISAGGQGFSGIARKKLLSILQQRATEVGVELRFETEVSDLAGFADADVIVFSDGANSAMRRLHSSAFGPELQERRCRYVWLGTHKRFDAFTFAFEETDAGWFAMHAYRFDRDMGTVIVETREETWRAAGLEGADSRRTIEFCERLFGKYLDGGGLMSNAAHLACPWSKFVQVSNQNWHAGNLVLLGDAAHTAHFSVGSGTKLAMEDAIVLARELASGADTTTAFAKYEAERRIEVLKLQNAARNSTEWFENVARYARLEPEQFAYSLLTRSQRVGHANLKMRDDRYVADIEDWVERRAAAGEPETKLAPRRIPPMFTPVRIGTMRVENRVAVSPMAMYSAIDGTPNSFHFVHFGSRALGGAGLIFTEMTCVAANGRISPGCCGMYAGVHLEAWRPIVQFVHEQSEAKFALQLGHSGPKGSTQLGWQDADEPLLDGNWPLIAPSAIAWGPSNQTPSAMTRADMAAVAAEFVRAAEMGARCGFDMLELHCAHGYLLSAFITPLTNRRSDEYGGSLANRLRFPLEVFAAVRAVWPRERPMSVRISATDWADDGISGEDSVAIAAAFKATGADLIDVSAGQTSRLARPVYGRMFQTPYADRIRNEVGITTMAVGNITEPDQVNGIIAAGRADICALARPHLADPYWTLHAAAALGYDGVRWPDQYLTGRDQLLRNIARAAQSGSGA